MVKDSSELLSRAAEELGAESLISRVTLGPNIFGLHHQSQVTNVSHFLFCFFGNMLLLWVRHRSRKDVQHDGCLLVQICEKLGLNTRERGEGHRAGHPQWWDSRLATGKLSTNIPFLQTSNFQSRIHLKLLELTCQRSCGRDLGRFFSHKGSFISIMHHQPFIKSRHRVPAWRCFVFLPQLGLGSFPGGGMRTRSLPLSLLPL